MSIASKIAGWIVKAGASSIIEAAQGGANIVDQFVETTGESRVANLAETASMRDFLLQQARNKSTLGAGWVGALGWVCTLGFALNFVVFPCVGWWLVSHGKQFTAPQFDLRIIVGMIAALLGLPLLEVLKAWFGTPQNNPNAGKKKEELERKSPIAAGDVAAKPENT